MSKEGLTFSTAIAFGKPSLLSIMSNSLSSGDSETAARLSNEQILAMYDNIIDYLKANAEKTTWIEESALENLDDLADGTTYKRVKSTAISAGLIKLDEVVNGTNYNLVLATQISAGKIYLSEASEFKAGFDPSGKRRVFTATPTTPYDVGDLWLSDAVIKRCTTANAVAYNATDWTAQTLDSLADGTTYKLVLATQISSGRISLTATNYYAGKFSGEWYSGGVSGVDLDATYGINIYGVNNALTTRATKTGTVQCAVNALGQITAGAGAVILDATGILIKGQVLQFQTAGGLYPCYIYTNAAGDIVLLPNSGDRVYCIGDLQIASGQRFGIFGADVAGVIPWSDQGGAYDHRFQPETDYFGYLGNADHRWYTFYSLNVRASYVVPQVTNTGNVGSADYIYSEMHSYLFVDHSPVRIPQALEKLKSIKFLPDGHYDKESLPMEARHLPDESDRAAKERILSHARTQVGNIREQVKVGLVKPYKQDWKDGIPLRFTDQQKANMLASADKIETDAQAEADAVHGKEGTSLGHLIIMLVDAVQELDKKVTALGG